MMTARQLIHELYRLKDLDKEIVVNDGEAFIEIKEIFDDEEQPAIIIEIDFL